MSPTSPLWPKCYCLVGCLVQRSQWPYFFENKDRQAITVTQHFAQIINELLALKLPPNHNLWFQQDANTAPMAVISKAVLRHLFPQWVISHVGDVPGPPCSPDITALDFFLWGYLKSKAYRRCPVNLNALKQTIRDANINISEATLREFKHSFSTCVHLCIHEGGGHLNDIVHKKWNNVKQISAQ